MPRRTKIQDPQRCSMPIFLFGLFLIGTGLFLILSFLTCDITIDPGRIPFVHANYSPDANSSANLCATGLFGAWAAYFVMLSLGTVSAYVFAFLIGAWGYHILCVGKVFPTWPQVLGGVVITAAFAVGMPAAIDRYDLSAGGLLANTCTPPAILYLGRLGLVILTLGAIFFGSILAFGETFIAAANNGWGYLKSGCSMAFSILSRLAVLFLEYVRPRIAAAVVTSADRAIILVKRPTVPAPVAPAAPVSELEVAAAVVEESAVADLVEEEPAIEPEFTPYGTAEPPSVTIVTDVEEKQHPRPPRKNRAVSRKLNKVHASADNPDYQLPPLNLLDDAISVGGEGRPSLEKRAKILEQTLTEFKIEGKVVHIECGPRVTMYEMCLAPGIRLNKITSLADNIAMMLKAPSVRIIAPIPGKDTIGIEIPNIEKQLVTLKDVVAAINRDKRKQNLPVCLGKDVSGSPLVADLTKMPHLLIAGATGSGKSVCINSIILSFIMCCKPNEAKMIMVDPKMVELSRFKEIPHLMSPVITDMKRAVAILEWACGKMDERYEQLAQVNVNNVTKFNALGADEIVSRLDGIYSEEELDLFPKHLPFVVIVIDELADLMMVAGKEVEQHITRLAAKSRAVGIHLILATQRPSVDVITGLIKANMPSRIAFQVSSRVDSRTILDQNGAETLLGAGDMLYLPPGVGKVSRAQGVFVSDEELFRVVDFAKAQTTPDYHDELEGPVIGGSGGGIDITDFDELFVQAGYAILESGRGSVSLLQRKLGIGYGRASRIIDQLASAGLLGPFRDGKAREIMMTPEDFAREFDGGQASMDFSEPVAGQMDDEKGPQAEEPWDDEG